MIPAKHVGKPGPFQAALWNSLFSVHDRFFIFLEKHIPHAFQMSGQISSARKLKRPSVKSDDPYLPKKARALDLVEFCPMGALANRRQIRAYEDI